MTKNQQKIVDSIKRNSFISIISIASNLKIGTTTVEENIAKLKEKGLIKRIGSAKGGHWEVKT